MLTLRFTTGAAFSIALLVLSVLAPPVSAEDEPAALERAIKLFEEGNYLAAQDLLTGIDRAKLNAQQQAVRDDYVSRVQVAITMHEKALRDLEDAETAVAEGEKEKAQRLLEGVLANEYAAESLRRSANASLRDLKAGGGKPPATVAAGQAPSQPPVETPSARPMAPQDAQGAREQTAKGDELARAGRYDEARKHYEQAVLLVPGFPEAVDGLQRLEEHQRNLGETRQESLIERVRRENQVNWQRTETEYRDAEKAVRDHVGAGRFEEANQMLVRARQIVEGGKQFADPPTLYESLRSEVEALSSFVRTEERAYHERKVAETRREIEEQRARQLQEVEERRAREVENLMRQAEQHRKDGDLEAAINVLKQVTVIDPKNQPARWRMNDFEDLQQYQHERGLRTDLQNETRRILHEVEDAKIPWHQQLRYPSNWLELISRPDRQQAGGSTRDSLLLSALDTLVPVDFRDEPFGQVIERLTQAHNLNIIVNWNDLKQAGIDRTVPIDLSLPQEITLKKAFTEILEQAGGGVDVGFEVADGAIKIATKNTLDKQTYTAVYDIRDLLMEIPMFNDAPMTDLSKINQQSKRAAQESQRSELPWLYGDDDDDEPEKDALRSDRTQKLINLIQDTVAPQSWCDHSGTIGTIKEINGQLVITQNSAAQRQIGDLFGKLRELRAIQVAVEARFITVSSHYLEELGIDLDIVLNAGNAGYDYVMNPTGPGAMTDPVLGSTLLLPRSFSRLGFTPTVPPLGGVATTQNPGTGVPQPFGQPQFVPQNSGGSGRQGTPVPVTNRVTQFTDASNLDSDVPGSFAGQTLAPAFSLFGSFLDNIQVDFLLRATQADSRTSVLTAPQLVLFNGQRAWVAVTIQQNFVSQLTPVVATGAVAQAPLTGTIDSGAVLDVSATVTADKRYVTMTVRPGVTRLLALQTIPFSGGGAGGGFGTGAALSAFIQLPTLSSQRVQTTVSVPDGGTLLIGGQKLAAESEVEAGVPILSKIPILKRLYSSRSMIKDEQTLLILIKPKILIQPEQEELAYPTFRKE